MRTKWHDRGWIFSLTMVFTIVEVARSDLNRSVSAQIISDRTLGAESSVVTPDTIKGIESDRISGGAVIGNNLFHSFREFNIGDGRGGYFENPEAIENIFSRVTGNDPSNIMGTLGVLGNANLFFLNPNGILFGPNASLDLNGSFLATTADSIAFPDGKHFSATDPEAPPLLTVNVQQPIGLEFQGREATISNQGYLAVDTGQNLALVGGDVILDGGIIYAPGGKVELGGLLAASEIALNEDGSFNFPSRVARGDVSLTNNSIILVSAGGGGSITVNARNFELLGSSLFAGIGGIDTDLGSSDAQAGDIKINATNNVLIDRQSDFTTLISNSVGDNSLGNAGKIDISAGNISLTNGGGVFSFVSGQGNTNDINLNARENILIDGNTDRFNTSVQNSVQEFGVGNSGNINLTAQNLILTNGGIIQTFVEGVGDSGDINLDVRDSISIDGEAIFAFGTINSGIDTDVRSEGIGNSGDINITTSRLSLTNGGSIGAFTFGRGNAGNINIIATESIILNGRSSQGEHFSGIESDSDVLSGAVGNGGNIQITTKDFSISNNALVSSDTTGRGNGGKIDITATNLSLINEGDISSSTFTIDAKDITEGNAGDITINVTDTLNLSDSAGISSSNLGNVISDGGIGVSILGNRIGNAGKIDITTSKLSLSNGSQISSFTRGRGNAGTITINATDSVLLDKANELEVATGIITNIDEQGVGNGGTININTNNLSLLDGAQIQNATLGEGNAGNITIKAQNAILISGQDPQGSSGGIFGSVQETAQGNGGTIDITSNDLTLFDGTVISVGSLGQGSGGNILVRANSLSLDRDSELRASTSFGTGGNIQLQLADTILLRNNSSISARATSNANGGNLTIDANFIVADPNENNDLIASAERGDGGNISITTNGIFGIEFRERETPLSDITASSEFGREGEVEINTSAVDPTRGLNNLLQEATEAEVAQSCQTVGGKSTLEFFDIGRGGLPPTPEDLLSSEIVIAEWIPLDLADEKLQEQSSDEIFSESELTTITPLKLSCHSR